MKALDLKIGDICILTSRRSFLGVDQESNCAAQITYVNEVGAIYCNAQVPGYLGAGQGRFSFDRVGCRYGACVAIRVIGHKPLSPSGHWSPRPGDRGYDSMC